MFMLVWLLHVLGVHVLLQRPMQLALFPGRRVRSARSPVVEHMEMADFCELFALSLQAGANFSLAFSQAQNSFVSASGKRFAKRVRSQIFCGIPLASAFSSAAQLESYEVAHDLASVMALAASMGGGVAVASQKLAQDFRNRSVTELDERAARVPVLMLFPLAIFILPVICVLLTAGAVSEFLRTLVM